MTKAIHVVLPDSIYKKLKKITDKEMRTVSSWVRLLLLKEIQKNEKNEK